MISIKKGLAMAVLRLSNGNPENQMDPRPVETMKRTYIAIRE
jgi:hypothetical protein